MTRKLNAVVITFLVVILLLVAAWVVNLVKITDCDVIAPYMCEVIHIAGIIPPVALVTVWFDTDKVEP